MQEQLPIKPGATGIRDPGEKCGIKIFAFSARLWCIYFFSFMRDSMPYLDFA